MGTPPYAVSLRIFFKQAGFEQKWRLIGNHRKPAFFLIAIPAPTELITSQPRVVRTEFSLSAVFRIAVMAVRVFTGEAYLRDRVIRRIHSETTLSVLPLTAVVAPLAAVTVPN